MIEIGEKVTVVRILYSDNHPIKPKWHNEILLRPLEGIIVDRVHKETFDNVFFECYLIFISELQVYVYALEEFIIKI